MTNESLSLLFDFFQTELILPVGSGSIGLFLALKLLREGKKQVVVPAATCPNVIVAVHAAGAQPVLADINPADFTLSPESVSSVITPHTGAIVAIDSFGSPADLDALRQLNGVDTHILVEDACQAYGGDDGMRKLGTRGDIGVISFGYAKPLELGGGGLLIAKTREIFKELSDLARKQAPWLAEWRNQLAILLMKSGSNRLFSWLARHSALLHYQFPPNRLEVLHSVWPGFLSSIEPMRILWEKIGEHARSIPGARMLQSSSKTSLPWRMSFCVPRFMRDEILTLLHQHGIHATSLYRPLDEIFWFPRPADNPNARALADAIINLACRSTVQDISAYLDRWRAFVSSRDFSLIMKQKSSWANEN